MTISIADLKPAPYNPRKISPEAVAGLKTSLVQFGDISGLTWNRRSGHLVAGHRHLAGAELEVPLVPQDPQGGALVA